MKIKTQNQNQKQEGNPLLLQPEPDELETTKGNSFFLTNDESSNSNHRGTPSLLSSANFDEFVRLRTENKSLKVQLIELSQGKGGKGSGNGNGNGRMKGSSSNIFM